MNEGEEIKISEGECEQSEVFWYKDFLNNFTLAFKFIVRKRTSDFL